jgi:hypothetical protein
MAGDSIGMESLCMCGIGAKGEDMLYILYHTAKSSKKEKKLRTHAHHYHGCEVPNGIFWKEWNVAECLYGGYSDPRHAVLWYLV